MIVVLTTFGSPSEIESHDIVYEYLLSAGFLRIASKWRVYIGTTKLYCYSETPELWPRQFPYDLADPNFFTRLDKFLGKLL